jgi:DNA repair exonuclease SbcCD nuclease subunit
VRIVHAADLHLDSPLVGLERYDGAPVHSIRSATRRAFSNLVELCLREQAALLLIAGDLFDDDWKDYSTGLFFVSQLQRLAESGTRVVTLRGNHDAVSHITRHLSLPEHVSELSSKRAETIRFDELRVAVHGKSYAERAETTNLALSYPDPVPGYFNIGLLHTSVSGRPGHEPYAPCSVADLVSRGYDSWALGHVHQREVLCETPWIVFPGNLQGRHLREPGPRGATVVHVEGGLVQRVEARDLSVVRFGDITVEAGLEDDADAITEAVARAIARAVVDAEGRTLVLRTIVSGVTAAHSAFQLEPEEQQRLEQRVIDGVQQRCGQRKGRPRLCPSRPQQQAGAEPEHDDPDVLDRMEGEQPLQLVLEQRVHDPGDRRQRTHREHEHTEPFG